MLGLKPGTVELSEPDHRWSELFQRERDRIKGALGSSVLAIEHVGSTSVPGLSAKPIVDIAAAVESFEAFALHVPTVEKLGYLYRGENGIPRRHYFVLGSPRTVHLHFLEHHGDSWHGHLIFREKMRASAELRRQYLELKRKLAAQFPNDRDAYTAGKQKFMRAIVEPALAARHQRPTPD